MTTKQFILASMLFSALALPAPAVNADDATTVYSNVRHIVLGDESELAKKVTTSWKKDLQSMKPDGSWADLDYDDHTKTVWAAMPHLVRLERIARGAYSGGEPPAAVKQQIVRSLQFWLAKDPKHSNWWFNEIAVPRNVGMVLVMLGDDAPADVKARGIELMKRADWTRQTGANLLDETWDGILRGVVERSADTLKQNFDRSWQEMHIASPTEEGIQEDGSFHQHGNLLYSQSYGTVFLNCATRIIEAGQSTEYMPPQPSIDALNRFVVSGDAWFSRHWVWDFGTCGRAICRKDATKVNIQPALDAVSKLPGRDSKQTAELAKQIQTSDDTALPVGNSYFWNSDYLVQRRPDYFASVRMYSDRVSNTDSLTTNENRKSHHIADGATCLMLSGNEYFNIYPVWDWMRIPGTTIEQDTPMEPKGIKRLNRNSFVGGVSDGSIGCAAMDFVYNDLRARKTWFCFDHCMVCLGCDIQCPSGHDVLTTINQCVMHGDVKSSLGTMSSGEHQHRGAAWFWQDGIGYVVGGDAAIDLKLSEQHGTWADIGNGTSDELAINTFNLVLDHGTRPTNGSYEYAILLATDATHTQTLSAHPAWHVISNTSALQAVEMSDAATGFAVFHDAGKVTLGRTTIEAKQPCLVMCTHDTGEPVITVSDPTQKMETLEIAVNGKIQSIELPRGNGAGKSASITTR